MALKKCRECGNQVSNQAKVCPHCGVKNPVPGWTKGAKVFMGLLVIVGVIAIVTPNASDVPVDYCNSDKTNLDAWFAAKEGVKVRLKAPDDADFAGMEETSVSKIPSDIPGECRFKVQSFVTAQNSFGAKLKNPFVAYVKGRSDSELFQAVEVSISNQ